MSGKPQKRWSNGVLYDMKAYKNLSAEAKAALWAQIRRDAQETAERTGHPNDLQKIVAR